MMSALQKVDQMPVRSNEVTPADLLQMAVEKGADLEKLEKLMDLQDRWETNRARKAFVAAMAEFKAEGVRVRKDKHVSYGNTDYHHATLGGIVDAAIPVMSKHGLSHRWAVTQSDKSITVHCVITHIEGHSESVELTGMADTSGGKNAIQAIGSAVTYLQRYTLISALGLASHDDDGVAASSAEPVSEEFAKFADLIAEADSDALSSIAKEIPGAKLTPAEVRNLRALYGKRKREVEA